MTWANSKCARALLVRCVRVFVLTEKKRAALSNPQPQFASLPSPAAAFEASIASLAAPTAPSRLSEWVFSSSGVGASEPRARSGAPVDRKG